MPVFIQDDKAQRMILFLFVGLRMSYSDSDVVKALEEIKGGSKIAAVAKKYGIPRTTLSSKHRGIYPAARKMGPATILTVEEENHLKDWLLHLSDSGFPATKQQLIDSVQMLVKRLERPTPFTDGRPGRHWYEAFLKRHPNISQRISQNSQALDRL